MLIAWLNWLRETENRREEKRMKNSFDSIHGPPTFRGRNLGMVVLVVAQLLIGTIHVFSGFLLLFSNPTIYSIYTLVFGMSILIFAYGLWFRRSWGWNGTVVISAFVIVADLLTVFNLPSIPGIPKLAAAGEIGYSLLILSYLFQTTVRSSYTKQI